MDVALLKECVMRGARLYQLGINLLAAHTCASDFAGLAEIIKKDRPAKCQEAFCNNPSTQTFRDWCLASTLEARNRPFQPTHEKSFEDFLFEEETQKATRALFQDQPCTSGTVSKRKRSSSEEPLADNLDDLFDLQDKATATTMAALSQAATSASETVGTPSQTGRRHKRKQKKTKTVSPHDN